MSARSARFAVAAVLGVGLLVMGAPVVTDLPSLVPDDRGSVSVIDEVTAVPMAQASAERARVWALPALGLLVLAWIRSWPSSAVPALALRRRRTEPAGGVGRRAPPV